MPTHVSKTILLKPARKALDKMDMKTRRRLIDGIKGLEQIPAVGDIKPLSGIIRKAPTAYWKLSRDLQLWNR